MKLWQWLLLGGGGYLLYRNVARGSMTTLSDYVAQLNAGNKCGEQYMVVEGPGSVQVTVYKFGDMSTVLDTLQYTTPAAAQAALAARMKVCGA